MDGWMDVIIDLIAEVVFVDAWGNVDLAFMRRYFILFRAIGYQ